MPGDPLKYVQPGQPLEMPAQAFNTFVDVGRWFRNQRQQSGAQIVADVFSANIAKLKNTSGGDRGRFHVLGLNEPIFTPTDNLTTFQNTITFKGITPDANLHWGKWGLLLDPLKANAIGRALLAGLAVVQIDVVETVHAFADILPTYTDKLRSGWIGAAEILWKESGTGTKWAIIRLGAPIYVTYVGKTDASIAKNASGTISIHEWNGTAWADTGANLTGAFNHSATINAGKWVSVEHIRVQPGKPWQPLVAALEC
jgi:hypothetical protein